MVRVLIVGELLGYATTAAQMAHKQGARVVHVLTISEALEGLRQGKGADLIFIDLRLDIRAFVKQLKEERFCIPLIACGINPHPDEAARSIYDGAKEYLPLPPNADFIAVLLQSISQQNSTFLYKDPKMEQVVRVLNRVSRSNANILISGESGTGKEVIANYIHRQSQRNQKPFVAINCAAIPENLLESELFGHEKGAFTGAMARRIGKFEEANEGTLFLDEISEMHPRLQAKLLRAIQERCIDRVGGTQSIHVDIRILASSNRKLEDSVERGDFRQDLFFRINVVHVTLPPLRERPFDILLLADFFLKKYAKLNQVTDKKLSDGAKDMLLHYKWPGNVRELENRMHRSILLCQSETIEDSDIFDTHEQTPPPLVEKELEISNEASQNIASFVGKSLPEVERVLILETLKKCTGNRTHAAQILGISIRTLRNKLKEYKEKGFYIPLVS